MTVSKIFSSSTESHLPKVLARNAAIIHYAALQANNTPKQFRQNVLAEACNVALSTYANWEQGRTLPPLNQIPVLADFFGVTTDYLLGVSKKEAADRLASRMESLPENYKPIVEALIDQILKGQG